MAQKVTAFKSLPRSQVSDDLLWAINGRNNSFIRKTVGTTLSLDPTNLTGLNLKRDSGITSQEGLGITLDRRVRTVKEKKSKKKVPTLKFSLNIRSRRNLHKRRAVVIKTRPVSNNRVYSSSTGLSARSVVKAIRGLKNYRPDLQRLALKKLVKLQKAKRRAKNIAKKESKTKK